MYKQIAFNSNNAKPESSINRTVSQTFELLLIQLNSQPIVALLVEL